MLALSSFMDWYAGSGVGVKLAVIGWHTGVLGKLVFFIGLAVLAIVALRELGFELPPTIPESLVVLALGALAAIFVLIRVISIPDAVLPADGRGIGIWISLLAALGVIPAACSAQQKSCSPEGVRGARTGERRTVCVDSTQTWSRAANCTLC